MPRNKLNNLCIYSEGIGLASRTLEICKKYTSSDIANDNHEIVFVYNHENQYFNVYDNIQDLLTFNSSEILATFESEEKLVDYLSGDNVI